MTREAVVEGFERFVDDAIEKTATEFSIARAIQGGAKGPGGGMLDEMLENSNVLHTKVVEPELEKYRQQTNEQFSLILDYAESGEEFEAFRDELLAADAFVSDIRSDIADERKEEIKASLLARHRGLGNAVKPLIESAETDFWDAAAAELTTEEAETLVEEHFAFTEPIREHRDAFRMETVIDVEELFGGLASFLGTSTLEVGYTDEALRAMRRAEQSVIATAKDEVEDKF